jgi:hypothetical protein
VTSTEAREIEEDMSGNESGKMKLVSIEEPSAAAALTGSSPNKDITVPARELPVTGVPHLSRLDEESAVPAIAAHNDDIEGERARLLNLFQILVMQRANTAFIMDTLKDAISHISIEDESQDSTGVTPELKITWIKQLKEAIELTIDLEKRKENCTGAALADALEVETSVATGRDTLIESIASCLKPRVNSQADIAKTQSFSMMVDQLMGIIGCSKERCHWLLIENSWDVESAVAAHYDGPAAEFRATNLPDDMSETEIAMAILASPDQALLNSYSAPPAKLGTRASSTTAKFKSSRRRVRWAPNPTVAGPSGIKNMPKLTKEAEEAELVADRARVARLIRMNDEEEAEEAEEGRDFTPRSKRSMSTFSRTSEADIARDMTDYDPSTIRTSIEKPTASTKRASFQTVLDVCGPNASKKQRDSTADIGSESPPKRQCGTTGDTALTTPRETNRTRSIRESTQLRPQSLPKSIFVCNVQNALALSQAKLATLRSMGFEDEERNARVLGECFGEVELAADSLSRPSDSSSGDLASEAEEMEHTQSMNFEALVSTYKGEGKVSQHRDSSSSDLDDVRTEEQQTLETNTHAGKKLTFQATITPSSYAALISPTTSRSPRAIPPLTDLSTNILALVLDVVKQNKDDDGPTRKSKAKGKDRTTAGSNTLQAFTTFQQVFTELYRVTEDRTRVRAAYRNVLEQLKTGVEEVRQRRKDSALGLGLGRGGYNGRDGMKRHQRGGEEGDETLATTSEDEEEDVTLGLEQALRDAEKREKGQGEGDVDMGMED